LVNALSLYETAQAEGIPVLYLPVPENGSLCLQTAERCYIALDTSTLHNEASRKVHLAHELGHCVTGSFYNRHAALDLRQRHENRADKWAIQALVPKEQLDDAVAAGHTEVWELAEVFGVTEPFMRKAIQWYTCGNLDCH